MSHATGDKLVYCHEALHMKYKLQEAGYKQAVEKWYSDSDSDESDEEDLNQGLGTLVVPLGAEHAASR